MLQGCLVEDDLLELASGAVAVSASGNAYEYSYGQELSRLYAMSRAAPG